MRPPGPPAGQQRCLLGSGYHFGVTMHIRIGHGRQASLALRGPLAGIQLPQGVGERCEAETTLPRRVPVPHPYALSL